MTGKAEQKQAIEELQELLHPGDTVYTILRHISASGMMRVIDTYIIRDNQPLRLSWKIAKAIDHTYDRKHEGIKVTGCGMDMGYHIVHNLSSMLFCNPDGSYSHDGAYALNHRWM